MVGWQSSCVLVPWLLALPVALVGLVGPAGAQIDCLEDCDPVPDPAHPGQFERAWGGRLWGAHHWYDATSEQHTLWVGEDGGKIRRSDDGGVTWAEQETPREMRGLVHGIFFLEDGLTGWAVSGYEAPYHVEGHLIGTLDGGNCWTYLEGFDEILFDVHFLNDAFGWIVGDHILKVSEDGGCTWTDEAFEPILPSTVPSTFDPATSEFYAIDSWVNPANGNFFALVSAEPGVVLRRTRTNELWTVTLFVDPNCADHNYPEGLTLLDPPCGCEIEDCEYENDCDPLELWDVSIAPDGSMTTAVAYVVGGIGHSYGVAFRGEDGGTSWSREDHECDVLTSCDPTSTSCNPPLDCDVEGYDSYPTLYGVHAIDSDNAVACAYGGGVYKRDPDSPVNWTDGTDRCLFGAGPLQSMIGDALGNAWTFGFFGAIRSTTDGGDTWIEHAGDQTWRLEDVCFIDEANGWVVGQSNRIAYTADGGDTWTVQHEVQRCSGESFNNGRSLRSIVMADGLNGVAVGQTQCPSECSSASEPCMGIDPLCLNEIEIDCCKLGAGDDPPTGCYPRLPLILFTEDGGETWDQGDDTEIDSDAENTNLRDVACSGNNGTHNEYWAVGPNSLVLHSADGGETWTSVEILFSGTPPAAATLSAVAFKDLNTGWVVGWNSSGAIGYRVTNATSSPVWTDFSPTGVGVLNDVALKGANVWAVGERPDTSEGSMGTVVAWRPSFSTFAAVTGAQSRAEDADLLSVAVVPDGSGQQVFVGGTDGLLLWSSDGTNWYTGDSEVGENIRAFSFTSTTFGFLVGGGDGLNSHGDSTMARYED